MLKRGILILIITAVLAGNLSAQEKSNAGSRHQSFDMLLGFDFGFGLTPNIGGMFNLKKGNYAVIADIGINYDFYLLNWLSFNTGLLLHEDVYLLLEQDLSNGTKLADVVAAPTCLTIPFAAHINVPALDWLYAGVGLNLNIPLFSTLKGSPGWDPKGDFFIGLPIDLGFDLTKPNTSNGRFFFRVTPEFHKRGTVVPIGFIWQTNNWKIYGKN
jgi:hypothetical protein